MADKRSFGQRVSDAADKAADATAEAFRDKSIAEDQDAYMKNEGKQRIKDQQQSMKDTGDEEAAKEGTKHKIPSYKKGGKIRKTGLAYMHKGEKVTPVKAQRKKG
jgi:hypothetical protein